MKKCQFSIIVLLKLRFFSTFNRVFKRVFWCFFLGKKCETYTPEKYFWFFFERRIYPWNAYLAKYWLSGDHLSPQTSCLWPANLRSGAKLGVLISRCRINLSRLPLDNISPFQAKAPTLNIYQIRYRMDSAWTLCHVGWICFLFS